MSVTQKFRFETRDSLNAVVSAALDLQSTKVHSILIEPGVVTIDSDKEIVINVATTDVFNQIRENPVELFELEQSESSVLVLIACVLLKLRAEKLYPGYIVISDDSVLKKDDLWQLVVDRIGDTMLLGLQVLKDDRLDATSIVIAACSGPDPRAYTVSKSVRVVI